MNISLEATLRRYCKMSVLIIFAKLANHLCPNLVVNKLQAEKCLKEKKSARVLFAINVQAEKIRKIHKETLVLQFHF